MMVANLDVKKLKHKMRIVNKDLFVRFEGTLLSIHQKPCTSRVACLASDLKMFLPSHVDS